MGEGGGGEEKGSFSSSPLSLFRFHLSPFPPETPDTQASFSNNKKICKLADYPTRLSWIEPKMSHLKDL